MFYTYLWLRYDGTPYYAGKGKDDRAFTSKGHIVHCPKNKKFIILQEFLSESDAFAAEVFLISYYGRRDLGTGCLANLTNGGEGSSGTVVSDETRKKHSISRTGRKHSEETKIKISEGNKGKKKRHCKLSPEHLRKLQVARWPIPEGMTREQYLQEKALRNREKGKERMRKWRKANPEKERLSWEKSNNRRKKHVNTH